MAMTCVVKCGLCCDSPMKKSTKNDTIRARAVRLNEHLGRGFQVRLADMTNLTRQRVGDWLRKPEEQLSLDNLERMEAALNEIESEIHQRREANLSGDAARDPLLDVARRLHAAADYIGNPAWPIGERVEELAAVATSLVEKIDVIRDAAKRFDKGRD